jgi:hypothetical protein
MVPVFAIAGLVVFTLIARELKYALTSSSLLVVTGTLVLWFAGAYWLFS